MNVTSPQKVGVGAKVRLPQELLDSSLFLLKRLGTAAKERSLAAYEEAGFSPYHHAVLALLDEGSRETQGAVADALGYDRGMLVGILDELEQKNLIERKRDPNDRRRHVVRLTADGKRALGKLRAISRRLENEFFAPLDEDERRQMYELMQRLADLHDPRCVPALPPRS
ncbi:MAG: MarR family winged helix-turn-helix transcriptional regulator [Gaiellaceae bacterium]